MKQTNVLFDSTHFIWFRISQVQFCGIYKSEILFKFLCGFLKLTSLSLRWINMFMIWYVPYAIISLLYLVGEQWTWEEESVVRKRSQLLLIGWQVVKEAREVQRRSVEPKPGPSGHHHCWGNKKWIKLYNILGENITCVTSIPTLYLTRNYLWDVFVPQIHLQLLGSDWCLPIYLSLTR